MMNHFLLDSGPATGAASAAGCSAGDSAAGGSTACASGPASSAAGWLLASSQTNCSSSCILYRLLCESLLDSGDRLPQHRVDNLEIGGEGEDGKDDDRGCTLYLFAVGPSNALHFELQLPNIILGDRRPLFNRLEP